MSMLALIKRLVFKKEDQTTSVIVAHDKPAEDDWERQRREEKYERDFKEFEMRAKRIEDEYEVKKGGQ